MEFDSPACSSSLDKRSYRAVCWGFQQITSEPIIFVLLVLGVFMGIVFGSIPGLTGALAISLVLPFTYHMTANNGLSLLIAIYVDRFPAA